MEDKDIIALATIAKRRGYGSIEAVTAYLEDLINRNEVYLSSRRQRRIHTGYDDSLSQDNAVLAMAIVLLESTQQS
ncbi:hypothetical protein [Tengunoibacter tsumagoiensis]|uniref:Uncharacterized protein n=1 Tax=Tengunoibacter tsumagoiensis TaxID=2014871 RepID=A0A402A4Z4_9CHLR|nr:hypothetical protein [Tengunoibacter tsumagoiensis]GCE14170.1 hypothetical protein KTT_40290 [Tengunoibacter tsumagoiensis]GCE14224.1 hypothetical protein KTT_40830 [Tengunoibacter tsumagoiensis]